MKREQRVALLHVAARVSGALVMISALHNRRNYGSHNNSMELQQEAHLP